MFDGVIDIDLDMVYFSKYIGLIISIIGFKIMRLVNGYKIWLNRVIYWWFFWNVEMLENFISKRLFFEKY